MFNAGTSPYRLSPLIHAGVSCTGGLIFAWKRRPGHRWRIARKKRRCMDRRSVSGAINGPFRGRRGSGGRRINSMRNKRAWRSPARYSGLRIGLDRASKQGHRSIDRDWMTEQSATIKCDNNSYCVFYCAPLHSAGFLPWCAAPQTSTRHNWHILWTTPARRRLYSYARIASVTDIKCSSNADQYMA